MKKRRHLTVVAVLMSLFFLMVQQAPMVHAEGESAVTYDRSASAMDLKELPGVYTVKAVPGDGMGESAASMGIPSVAKQTLADKPTTESPAIIMGAAVNYEKKVGPTDFELLPGKEGTERVAPYSYFRHAVIEEQMQDVDGNVTTHKKMSGFDGSYYIIRVDVSDIVKDAGEGKYLHVKQESNKALMVAYGMEGTTFSDALGNKTGSYSLDENAKAMKDSGKEDEIPYFDVIVMSSGKLSAGADAGQSTAMSPDIKLSFYVDDVADYKPNLPFYETAKMPTFPTTIDGVEYKAETDYISALLTKFFDDTKATTENKAAKYLVKGSDLEIDVMVDEKENPDGVQEFWSMEKAIAYPKYNAHVIKLICEVPVLDGLSIEGTADNPRSVILDVNSFDIQIANNSEKDTAGISVGAYSELRLMDGSNTAGAELAIGNNATMIVKKNASLIIDESCTAEAEFDAASITDPSQQTTPDLINGEITIQDGGKLINYGVVNVEGTESKPQPQDPEQASQETVVRDIRSAYLLVEEGGELENHGCISLKGDMYVLGSLTNDGKYKDIIHAGDPDKGYIDYHKGIQITWKDDVRNKEVRPGILNIGIDADKKIVRTAKLENTGDIVITPGQINVYGALKNTGDGRIYLDDVKEAIVPIQPSKEEPLKVEIRVEVDPMRPGLICVDKDAALEVAEGSVMAGAVQLISNGVLGTLTPGEEAKGIESMIGKDDFVISANDGTAALTQGKDFALKDGGIEFTSEYLGSFSGTRTVTLNIGYRYFTFTAEGTKVETCTHAWDSGKVTKAATCTKDGVKTFTCTKCGETRTEVIKATGHKELKDKAVAATFTRKGKTAGSHCSVCGKVIKKQTVIPMKSGIRKLNGKLYFYKNGTKLNGWQSVGNKRYFFKKVTKAAATGKVKIGKYHYYFSKKAKTLGQLQTGRVKIGTKYYFFSKNAKKLGQMQTGWVKIGTKYYYFSKKAKTLGQMVTGKLKIGKKAYRFNKNGVCLNR